MRRKSLTGYNNAAYLYLLPWIAGMLLLQLYPFIISFYYALCDYNPLRDPVFTGFNNFKRLFTIDPEFFISLRATLLYVLYTVPLKLLMSLFIAMLLNRSRKGIGILRTAFYLPSLFSGSVAVAVLWQIMFMDQGMVNAILNFFGISTVSFFGSTQLALPTFSLLEVWQFGSSMVLFLAALKQVPAQLYEAAIIDGAGSSQRFFKITLPYISPVLFFCIIMQTLNAIQNFTSILIITQGRGTPLKSTYLLGLKLYNDGFQFWRMGYASATSWVIFSIIAVFTALLFISQKYWVFYSDES